jgi:hypothetical protein
MRLSEELRAWTKDYASGVIQCYVKLPKDREEVRVLGDNWMNAWPSSPAWSPNCANTAPDFSVSARQLFSICLCEFQHVSF